MSLKWAVVAALGIGLGIFCVVKMEGQKAGKVPVVKYTCVAGPDEKCASDLWYADYLRLKGLEEKYSAPADVRDLMVGITTRLRGQIPTGYEWNEEKKRFVKVAEVPVKK